MPVREKQPRRAASWRAVKHQAAPLLGSLGRDKPHAWPQVDSTAQFLDWFKKPFPGQGSFDYARRRAQELEEQRRKPQPVQTTWAIGSM